MPMRSPIYDAYQAASRHIDCGNQRDRLDELIYVLSHLSDAELREVAETGQLPHKCDFKVN